MLERRLKKVQQANLKDFGQRIHRAAGQPPPPFYCTPNPSRRIVTQAGLCRGRLPSTQHQSAIRMTETPLTSLRTCQIVSQIIQFAAFHKTEESGLRFLFYIKADRVLKLSEERDCHTNRIVQGTHENRHNR